MDREPLDAQTIVIRWLTLLLLPFLAGAGILPASRTNDWRTAGATITNRTVITTNITGMDNTGVQDVTAGLQHAITYGGTLAYLTTGVYRITSPLTMNWWGGTLRGAGATNTVITNSAGGERIKILYDNWGSFNHFVTADLAAGATNLSLVGAPIVPMQAGSIVRISETNDLSRISSGIINADGMPEGYFDGALRQVVRVLTVDNETNLTFSPALRIPFYASNSAAVTWHYNGDSPYVNHAHDVGIEELTVTGPAGANDYSITITGAKDCWLKGVESANGEIAHVFVSYSMNVSILDGVVRDGNNPGAGGGSGYGIYLSDCEGVLVQNNIFLRNQGAILVDKGTQGSVIGYNYFADPRLTSGAQSAAIQMHSAYPCFNLIEGNHGNQFWADYFHGGSGDFTVFRNYFTPATNSTAVNWCIAVDEGSYRYNILGNVLGANSWSPTFEPVDPKSYNAAYIRTIGYSSSGDDTVTDTNVAAGLIWHGNYDYANDNIVWDGTIADHDLPSSYYLAAKPSWYGTNVWPSVDPIGPLMNRLPAETRYLGGASGGGEPIPPPPDDPPGAPVVIRGAVTIRGNVTIRGI